MNWYTGIMALFTNPTKKPSLIFADAFKNGVTREDLIRRAEEAKKAQTVRNEAR